MKGSCMRFFITNKIKFPPKAALRSSSALLILSWLAIQMLSSCQIEVEVKREDNFEGIRQVHRGSVYSTYVNGKERVGTNTKIFYDEELVRQGNKTVISRRFVDDNSIGYHRKSLPWELIYRTPITYEVRNDTVVAISGFENFKNQVIPRLQIPTKREKEIIDYRVEPVAARHLRHEWFLTHLLEGTFKTKENVTDRIRFKKFGDWMVDSVTTVRVEDIDDRDCFRYEVHYQEKLKRNHLMFEQFYAAYHPDNKQFDLFDWDSGRAETIQSVWTDLETGRLCKTHLNQVQFNVAKHRETGEPLEFKVVRFSEALYTYPHDK